MSRLKGFLSIGHKKEQQAKQWLLKQGIKIVAENFRCKGGEIDLIGTSNNTLIFFEVKYRSKTHYGHPAEMVTYQKQQRIILCAQQFLLKNSQFDSFDMQFDVMTFIAQQTEPQWIENAFQTN